MSDFYEEQISDLEDHVGGLEIDLQDMRENYNILRDALELISSKTNHVAHDSSEARMMIYEACKIAKQALEITK